MIFELQHEEQTVAFFITKTTKSKAKCLEKKIPGKKRLLESEKYQVNFEKLLSENWCNREIPIKFVIVGVMMNSANSTSSFTPYLGFYPQQA